MKWTSQLSLDPDLARATREVAEKLTQQFEKEKPDLLLAFLSGYGPEASLSFPRHLSENFPFRLLIGCTAGGVIGGNEEVEGRPALSLTGALLPGVEARGFHVSPEGIPTEQAEAKSWQNCLRASPAEQPHFIFLPDPFSFDVARFLRGTDRHFPDSNKIGGLASGAVQHGMNRLFLNQETYDSGLVGVSLWGNLAMDTLVAQGCRPIGQAMFVTRCQQNLLQEIDGKAPSAILQSLYLDLEPRDQELFRQSLFLGLAMHENHREYRPGDFLIRNILGVDESGESLVVGASLREGQVVQFHLRDGRSSSEELNAMLIRHKTDHLRDSPPAGALLFSCLGRGSQLFGEANHDSRMFQRFEGPTPIGGFFCNGEIGPVHGRSYLHGYTSAFGIFRPKERS